jgi:hypothetical protein
MLPVPDTRSILTAPQNVRYELPMRAGKRQRGRQMMADDGLRAATTSTT